MPAIATTHSPAGSSAPLPTWAMTVPATLADVHEPVAPRQPNTRTTPSSPQTLVRVIGTLMQDAEWRVTAGNRAIGMIVVLVEQPGSVPIRATQIVGTDRLAHVSGSAKAHRLVRGTVVQIEGNVLTPHPTGRSVELFGVADIVERARQRPFRVLPAEDD